MQIDKVKQAERKLSGLCEVCGDRYGPNDSRTGVDGYDWDSNCKYKDDVWHDTSKDCKDYIVWTKKHVHG